MAKRNTVEELAREMTKVAKPTVEIDAREQGVILINGEKWVMAKVKTKKMDKVVHSDRFIYKKLDEVEFEKDINTILDKLEKQTNSRELLRQLIKDMAPHQLKRVAKRIKENKPVKKHLGCLGFKIGDAYMQLID